MALGFTNNDGLMGVVMISILRVAYLSMSHVKANFAKDTIIIEH